MFTKKKEKQMPKQEFRSPIELGEKYTDSVTGITGTAVVLVINGYTNEQRVELEHVWDNEPKYVSVDVARIEGIDLDDESNVYETELVLGEKYVDVATGIEGTATNLFFHQHACEQTMIERWDEKTNDRKAHTFDVQRLAPVETPSEQLQTKKAGGPTRHHAGLIR